MKRHKDDYDYLFKVVVVGNAAVGKSALLNRYVHNEAPRKYMATIGVDFKVTTSRIDNALIKLQWWDSAGSERFRSITSHYYRGAHAVMIVYDITNADSLKSTQFWIDEVSKNANDGLIKLLVGNKSDVVDDYRKITYEEGNDHAKEHDMQFFETSAASGENVKNAFLWMTEAIYSKQKQKVRDDECDHKEILNGGSIIALDRDWSQPGKRLNSKVQRCCQS